MERHNMNIILMDVDDTLYPRGKGPFTLVNEKIEEFVMTWCGIASPEAKALRKTYIEAYGSTLGGLMKHHGVDPGHYLTYVHDVPVEALLSRDDRLQQVLGGIRNEMVVFSNGSRDYVERVLNALGVSRFFRDLFTIETMDYVPKPRDYPYRKVIERYGRSPSEFVLVDDRSPNILTARSLGMKTILVGPGEGMQDTLIIPDIYAISSVVS
jgi:putative hydrolase of the HAD superfamily